ncbi:hypothetical protein F8G81_02380 [Arthrobacter sp. CDRTa11]|uniref:hypothetical protein n=1 Tax=Arthrobacter sp. CDRTa11 TaxID=2651199 RepID=UPI002265A2C8|nr:hypothetical protein [Arthrobacter sp. CDRTa11]UZX05264.1 hypothetical protein F8G81_02380 [Arthrobacter sp. CDRTa11]
MKRIALLKERQAPGGGQAPAPTGSHCPASGFWAPGSDPQAVQLIFEGQVFPAFDGVPTVWVRRAAGTVSAG